MIVTAGGTLFTTTSAEAYLVLVPSDAVSVTLYVPSSVQVNVGSSMLALLNVHRAPASTPDTTTYDHDRVGVSSASETVPSSAIAAPSAPLYGPPADTTGAASSFLIVPRPCGSAMAGLARA